MPIRRDDYPPDWELRSRFVRFVRARGRCEWCGAKDGEPHPATGSRVMLTTAHIYDRNPMACSLLNLAALARIRDGKAHQDGPGDDFSGPARV